MDGLIRQLIMLSVTITALSMPAGLLADEASLYQAAKGEGQVVWYTTLIVNQAVRPLAEAFQEKYPGVDVKFARADSLPTALKIIQEARSGGPQADIFDGIETEPPVAKAGLVDPYISSHADRYPVDLRDPKGMWQATNLYFLTPGYNTALMSSADAPKTVEDLLAPRLKGRMAWSTARSAGGPIFIGAILRMMGDDRGMDFLNKLASQEIINADITARSILDQVIQGEYLLGLAIFNHHADLSARKGAPVDWVKLEPIAAPMQVTSIIKGARHPNAARLLLDFIASEDGQNVLASADYLPAMPSIQARTPSLKPEGGHFRPMYFPPDVMGRDAEKWEAIYKDKFR